MAGNDNMAWKTTTYEKVRRLMEGDARLSPLRRVALVEMLGICYQSSWEGRNPPAGSRTNARIKT
jgi:hypothetical protein